MIQAGSAIWFARHESRLAWRDWISMMTAGRRARARGVAIGFAAFIIFMHAIAYFVVGPSATATPDKHTMITITATLLLAWLLMISQAMESMTRAFYARADLDLILASPTAAHKLFAIRISTVALTVAAMAVPLAGPFIDMLILRGGIRWLGGYGVIIAMGTAAAALAVAMTVALFRAIGPKRTRLVAQVVAAVIGAAFIIGLQVAAILSHGTLSQASVLQSDALFALAPDAGNVLWWPARAVLGEAVPLAGVLIVSFVLLAVAVALVAPHFGDYAVAAAGADNAPAIRAQRRTTFRITSPRRALRRKEWILLRRDPWLVSQTLMQMLYLVPPAVLLWRSFEAGGGAVNLLVPVLVMAAGQLSGGLAWLTISGEDAPDLVATAPVPAGFVLRAKVEAVLGIIALDLRAAGRGPERRLAMARVGHRRGRCHCGSVGDRHSALVPHPGQTEPIPPPPGFLAHCNLCRGVLLDRLGRHRRGRRRQSLARAGAGAVDARAARRHALSEPAETITSRPAQRGGGTARRAVGGVSAKTRCIAQAATQHAPSTMLRMVPLPRFAGAEIKPPRPTRRPSRSPAPARPARRRSGRRFARCSSAPSAPPPSRARSRRSARTQSRDK